MDNKLRIWRVVPTNEFGVQAPYFFVETQESKLEKAEISALKKAEKLSRLSKFNNWDLIILKTKFRKDNFGRYIKYHQ